MGVVLGSLVCLDGWGVVIVVGYDLKEMVGGVLVWIKVGIWVF